MERPRAILFDLDDTIVDFEVSGQPAACWQLTLEAHADALGGVDPATAFAAIEATRDWFWSDTARFHRGSLDLRAASAAIVLRALGTLGVTLDEATARRLSDDYRDRRDAGLRLFDGARAALEQLRAEGLRLGLVTNGSSADQRAKLVRFELAPYFAHVLISGEFGAGKPDPRVYQHALRALDVAPAKAWFVGDRLDWDVGAPQAEGITGVWIDHAGLGVPVNATVRPDRIVRHIRELTA